MSSDLSLQFAKRFVEQYEGRYDEIMRRHFVAMECRDCEEFLRQGLNAFRWLRHAEETFRQAAVENLCTTQEDVELLKKGMEAVNVLFAWLRRTRCYENASPALRVNSTLQCSGVSSGLRVRPKKDAENRNAERHRGRFSGRCLTSPPGSRRAKCDPSRSRISTGAGVSPGIVEIHPRIPGSRAAIRVWQRDLVRICRRLDQGADLQPQHLQSMSDHGTKVWLYFVEWDDQESSSGSRRLARRNGGSLHPTARNVVSVSFPCWQWQRHSRGSLSASANAATLTSSWIISSPWRPKSPTRTYASSSIRKTARRSTSTSLMDSHLLKNRPDKSPNVHVSGIGREREEDGRKENGGGMGPLMSIIDSRPRFLPHPRMAGRSVFATDFRPRQGPANRDSARPQCSRYA